MKSLAFTITVFTFFPSVAQTVFERTFGVAYDDFGFSVQQTDDSGYIIAGTSGDFSSTNSVYVIKTDANGDAVWAKTYDGKGSAGAFSIQQTKDGGYIISGGTNDNTNDYAYLIKTDVNGDTIWTKVFGSNNNAARGVLQTSDEGYIIVGDRVFNTAIYLIKTDVSGNESWTETFGATGGASEYGESVQQTIDGGFIFTGKSSDGYLIKTDSSGNMVWEKKFGAQFDRGYSVQQTSDEGYIVSGILGVSAGLIKTDANGDSIWTKIFGGGFAVAHAVKQTNDGGYIVAGTYGGDFIFSSSAFLIKTNSNGEVVWTKTFQGAGIAAAYSVGLTDDGGYIVAGGTSGGTGYNVYLVKTDANGDLTTGIEEQSLLAPIIGIFPNPNDGSFSVFLNSLASGDITLQIINSLGKVIQSECHNRIQTIRIDLSNQPNGIYFLTVLSKKTIIATKKIAIY